MNFFILNPKRSKLLPLTVLVLWSTLLQAQFQVQDASSAPYTPTNLISNVFLGDGVEITDIEFSGEDKAIGYFSGGAGPVGIEEGIVLTTGSVETRPGFFFSTIRGIDGVGSQFMSHDNGSNITDPDLLTLLPNGSTYADMENAAMYTIKFIPTSDTVKFRYCFASEEYPEYACSEYNDVFGFFIQGPGYPAFTNIAKVPGTNQNVSINNVHPYNSQYPNCSAKNLQFYNNNLNSSSSPTFDGYTDVFTAVAVVTPCVEYTIKLAICDVTDEIYDSGVFLEAKSFSTRSISHEFLSESNDATVTEGCSDGTLVFHIPDPAEYNIPIDLNFFGTGGNGVDIVQIDPQAFFAIGSDKVEIPVSAILDNISEGLEYIGIDYAKDACTRDTAYIYIRENALLPPVLPEDTTVCLASLSSYFLDGTSPTTEPDPVTFSNPTGMPIGNAATYSEVDIFGQTGNIGVGTIESVCLNINHPFVEDLDIYLIAPNGDFMELTTDNGGNGDNFISTCFSESAAQSIVAANPPYTGSFAPEGSFADIYGAPINGTWQLQITDDNTPFSGDLIDWEITFAPVYSIDYTWTPSADVGCETCPITLANPTESTDFVLQVADNYGCTILDTFKVEVIDVFAAPDVDCINPSEDAVTFSWGDVSGAAGYEINIGGAGWQPVPQGDLSYSVTGLGTFTTVNVQIQAVGNIMCVAEIGLGACTTCQPPTNTAATTPTSCSNLSDGSFTISPDGLNAPYTFSLDTTTNLTGQFDNLASGDYSVVITDAAGCSSIEMVTLTSPDTLIATASISEEIKCFNGNNGQILSNTTGGSGGLTYFWNDGTMTASLTNVNAGVYSLVVQDNMGCQDTTSVVIGQPNEILVQTDAAAARCFGESSGTLEATAAGGVGDFIYAWDNGFFGSNLSDIAPGTYGLTVTDDNGCSVLASQIVDQATAITTSIQADSTFCHNSEDGVATVVPNGGAGGFSFAWSDDDGQTSASATGLPAGFYTVIVSDANNCTTTATAQVEAPSALAFSTQSTPAKCNGAADGTAEILPIGGTGLYNYLWENGQQNATASGLTAGLIGVTITDAAGCQTDTLVEVTEPAPIVLALDAQSTKCFGSLDGSIQASLQGGVGTFTYAWLSGQSIQNLQAVGAGNYTLTATDANGCSQVASTTVSQPNEILVNASGTDAKCFGENTGTGNAIAAGGTGGFDYLWSGPNNYQSNVASPNNLPAGNYQIVVTDALGCSEVSTVAISEPTDLIADLPTVADTICYLGSDGTATVYPSGGIPPYTFIWSSNDQTDQTAQNLIEGSFTVFITDANGCAQNATTYISQQDELVAVATPELPSCHDGVNGTATVLSASYGNTAADLSTLQYVWNTTPPQTTQTATDLEASSTYSVMLTDEKGCTSSQSVTVGNPAPIALSTDSLGQVRCFGDQNGWAAVSAFGGQPPYSYIWDANTGGQQSAYAQNLAVGAYKVTISDAKNCTQIQSVQISSPSKINIATDQTGITCFGEVDGIAKAVASGGVAPYDYLWEMGETGTSVTGLPAGLYQLTTTDAKGCTKEETVEVDGPTEPIDGVIEKQDAVCYKEKNGQITFELGGGTPPYRYSLDGETWNGSSIQIALGAGMYHPQVVDKNGCTMIFDPVQVNDRNQVTLDLGPDTTLMLGENVQLFPVVENAVAPIEYIWSSEDSIWLSCMGCPNPWVDSLINRNDFDLFIVDANGCFAEDQITINIKKDRRVFVPTGFTPNGDFNNDVLLTHGDPRITVHQFRVYDRWGTLVFQANDFQLTDTDIFWDGTFRGKALDPGTYVWTLEVEYVDNVMDVYQGTTHLIR